MILSWFFMVGNYFSFMFTPLLNQFCSILWIFEVIIIAILWRHFFQLKLCIPRIFLLMDTIEKWQIYSLIQFTESNNCITSFKQSAVLCVHFHNSQCSCYITFTKKTHILFAHMITRELLRREIKRAKKKKKLCVFRCIYTLGIWVWGAIFCLFLVSSISFQKEQKPTTQRTWSGIFRHFHYFIYFVCCSVETLVIIENKLYVN